MGRAKQEDQVFGKALRALLQERGHTQTWLAKKAGIPREQLNRRMKQFGLPPGDELSRIADALNVPIDALRGDETYRDRNSEHPDSFNDQERAAMNSQRGRAIVSMMAGFSEWKMKRLLRAATDIDQLPEAQESPTKEAVHRRPPK